jgi:hypothetical protein
MGCDVWERWSVTGPVTAAKKIRDRPSARLDPDPRPAHARRAADVSRSYEAAALVNSQSGKDGAASEPAGFAR